MSGVNKVILVGRLGADPEVRFTNTGMAIANFRMATSETWSGKDGEREERTEWHRIVAFGKLAEICGKWLSKGKQVYIEGRLQTRDWEDRDGNRRWTTEIVAREMVMLGRSGDEPKDLPSQNDSEEGSNRNDSDNSFSSDDDDNDVPF